MNCRACSSTDFAAILDLGNQPPANAYLSAMDEPEVRYPLALMFCRACGLAQLRDPQPMHLFDSYRYQTGASEPMRRYFAAYAAEAIAPRVAGGDLVIDIGGNDGTLLAQINPSIRRVNVDPAANLAEMNEAEGIEFVPQALDQDLAEDIVENWGHARVVCANNVLAHTDDPRSLLRAIATLIGDTGTLIAEVHWAHHLVTAGCWDQIYHEHTCYYSLHALVPLLRSCGLFIGSVEIVPSQGQSLRIFATSHPNADVTPSIQKVSNQEYVAGLRDQDAWLSLARAARTTRRDLRALIYQLKGHGKRIVGYGAPAKGNTLLNYCQIGRAQLDYLTDTTPLKQGLLAPGTRIPIVHPDRLHEDAPDYALLLAWNHRDAILAQERDLIARGMRFISAHPRVEILEPEDALAA